MSGYQNGSAVDFELKERAMDEAPVGITIADASAPDAPLIYLNDQFTELTGYDRSDVLGRNCRFLQGAETDPAAVTAMREAIDAGEPVSVELVNYRADGEEFWNEVTIAPVRDGDGNITHFVGFQSDVTRRKEAEFAVEAERQNLEHLLGRINGLIADVTEILMGGRSREATERDLCERIVGTDPYVFAWFGERDLVADVLVPSSSNGDDASLDGVEIALDDDDPTALAFETDAVRTTTDVAATACADRVPEAASMAAVPLTHRGTTYGVLTVYAADPDAFDERETTVLESIGQTIATAINAAESRRLLTADNVIDATIEIDAADAALARIAAEADCHMEYVGSVPQSDGSLLLFFDVPDAPPTRVIEAGSSREGLAAVTLLTDGEDGGLFEFHVVGDSPVGRLAELGAETREMTVDASGVEVAITLPASADVRTTIDRLRETYPSAALAAYRERERPPETRREHVAGLRAKLTNRQRTALQKAFVGGYFDRRRAITGDELAESMGISRSTFHQHLRAATRKLLADFFEEA